MTDGAGPAFAYDLDEEVTLKGSTMPLRTAVRRYIAQKREGRLFVFTALRDGPLLQEEHFEELAQLPEFSNASGG
jgi:hypothetical protein